MLVWYNNKWSLPLPTVMGLVAMLTVVSPMHATPNRDGPPPYLRADHRKVSQYQLGTARSADVITEHSDRTSGLSVDCIQRVIQSG
jgi:hypothetical protein